MSNTTDLGRKCRPMRPFAGLCFVLSLGLLAHFVVDLADLSTMVVMNCAGQGEEDASTTPEPLTVCDLDDDEALLAPTTMGSPLALTFAMATPRPLSLPRHQPPLVHPPKTQLTM